MKTCSRCKLEKQLESFCKSKATKDGFNRVCKPCAKEKIDAWRKGDARDAYLEYRREYYQLTFEANAAEKRRFRARHREKIQAREKAYRAANKPKVREGKNRYETRKKKEDSVYKTKSSIRILLNKAFAKGGFKREGRTADIIGCTFEQLDSHLVLTALANYGYYLNDEQYHIDHIVPMATAECVDDVLRLNHFSNLQLLYPEHNLAKHSKLDWKLT